MSDSPHPRWFELLPEAVVVVGQGPPRLVLNRAARRLFAGVTDEHLRQQLADIRSVEQAPREILRDDGSLLQIEWSCTPDEHDSTHSELVMVCRSAPAPTPMDTAEATLGVGSWCWYPDTDAVRWSPGVHSIFGVPEDQELDLEQVLSVLAPDDPPRVVDALSAAAAGTARLDLELRARRPDGTERWIRAVGSRLQKATGERVVCGLVIDIHTSQQIRAELERREALLARTERIASVGSWEWEVATGEIWWSEQTYRIFGLDPDQPPPPFPEHFQFYRPEDFERLRAAVGRAISDQVAYELRMPYFSGNGSQRFARLRGEPELGPDGQVHRLFGFIQDITDLHRTEQALRDSERLLENSERLAGVGGWSLDLRNGTLSLTDNWLRIHGLDPERPRPRTLDELTPLAHPEDLPNIHAMFEEAAAGAQYDIEHRIIQADSGEERIVRALAEPERDESGSVTRLHGAAQDVTEQRLADRERVQLQSAIDQSSDIVMVTDQKGSIRYVNPSFERITGYPPHEAIGRNPNFLASGEQPDQHFHDMWQSLCAGKTWSGRFINRRRDGTRYIEQASIAPVRNEHGEIVQFVSVKRDITAELERENHNQMAQRLEAVGRLAGGVAHDFNNLLQAILGNTEILLDRPGSDADTLEALESVQASAHRAADLTHQLLTFASRQATEPRAVSVNEVVDGMRSIFDRLLPDGMQLEVIAAEDLAPIVADPSQIEQVVANLVLNARDALGDEGRIEIRTANVPAPAGAAAQSAPHFVELSVRDDGPGMDDTTAARIFEPFFTTKPPHQGFGLGLATVYGIAEQHGGSLDVVTTPGEGALFRFRLPAHSGAEVPRITPQTPPTRRSHGAGTVLLVEDETAVRNTLKRSLQRGGYDVYAAGSMTEALTQLDRDDFAPDVVVTDVMMPGGSGLELVRRIRARERYARMPALIVSGFSAEPIHEVPGAPNRTEFLAKPFSGQTLVERLNTLLERPAAT